MRSIITIRLTAALALALILPVTAWTETNVAVPTPLATGGAAAPAAGHREKVEQRIADMHATLRISQEQEATWDQVAQVMLDNAQVIEGLWSKNTGDAATRDADAIMQAYVEFAQQHAQNVQKLAVVFHALYGTLSADQRLAADEMFRSAAIDRAQKQGG